MNDCFYISFLIPLTFNQFPIQIIHSIEKQRCIVYEILILYNGISNLVEEIKEFIYEDNIRIFLIRSIGKSNALNVGIQHSKYKFICVLDADCVLEENTIINAISHFQDINVSAVGGRLKTSNEKHNILTFTQRIEYMKTFNVCRLLFHTMNANYLISGAFGIFRKRDLLEVHGYDITTVGEDMELVLHLQELHKKIIYEKNSICYTKTPTTISHLLRQRDRWQRGLFDCLLKHKNLICNPKYGSLAFIAIPYQILFELLGPIFILLYFIFTVLFSINKIYEIWIFYLLYLIFETILTCIAETIEYEKWYMFFIKIPEAFIASILLTILSIPLSIVRVFGMITFHWRKMKW